MSRNALLAGLVVAAILGVACQGQVVPLSAQRGSSVAIPLGALCLLW